MSTKTFCDVCGDRITSANYIADAGGGMRAGTVPLQTGKTTATLTLVATTSPSIDLCARCLNNALRALVGVAATPLGTKDAVALAADATIADALAIGPTA